MIVRPIKQLAAEEVAEDHIRGAARRLRIAAAEHRTCRPVRDMLGRQDIAAAYAVQRLLTEAAIRDGRRVVGRKVGLTSPAVQRQLGVDQPDFGVLFEDMQHEDDPIDVDRLLQPKIEAEIAFVLAEDLDRPSLTTDAVSRATAFVSPALEIVDSRIDNWDISIVDTIADNASCGLFVLGPQQIPLEGLALPDVTMTLYADGAKISEGAGFACLGDPLNAVRWLANTAAEYGSPLRAGDIVLSGALGPMVRTRRGTQYSAEISGIGTVNARFS